MTKDTQRPSLKVRFDDPGTLEALRAISDEIHTSMNALVEGMIARELVLMRQGIALELEQTLANLRSYVMPSIEDQAERFARAEVDFADPLRSTQRSDGQLDPYGIGAAFAHPVEP